MNALNAAMTVIGAGSYGTALAITPARNGHHVVLWGHDPKTYRDAATRSLQRRVPSRCAFPGYAAS